jgi:hypothetical protein
VVSVPVAVVALIPPSMVVTSTERSGRPVSRSPMPCGLAGVGPRRRSSGVVFHGVRWSVLGRLRRWPRLLLWGSKVRRRGLSVGSCWPLGTASIIPSLHVPEHGVLPACVSTGHSSKRLKQRCMTGCKVMRYDKTELCLCLRVWLLRLRLQVDAAQRLLYGPRHLWVLSKEAKTWGAAA